METYELPPVEPEVEPANSRSPYKVRYIFYGLGVGLLLNTLLALAALVIVVMTSVDLESVASGGTDYSALTDSLTDDVMAAATSFPVLLAGMLGLWIGLAGVPWWASRKRGTGSLAADFGWRFEWKRDILIGLGAGLALRVVTLLIAAGASALGVDEEGMSNAGFLFDYGIIATSILVIAASIGAPIVEELFFRGLALQSLVRRWGPAVGVVVSSLLFGLMHFQAVSWGTVVIVGSTALAGAVFALLTLRYKRMGPAVMSHLTFNLSAMVILGVATLFGLS